MVRVEPVGKKLFANRAILFLGVVSFYVWLFLSEWWPLKVQNNIGGGRNYADLASVLSAARCYEQEGDAVYLTVESCGYQYGIFLLKFILLFELDSIDLLLIGGLFVSLVFLILLGSAVLTANNTRQAWMAFLIVTSPGPWLLFERGNFDLLITILVALGAVFINTRLSLLAVVFITLTALMKFYTLPLLLVYILIEKKVLFRIVAALTFCITTPFVLLDISRAPSFPNPTFVAFGLPSPGLWLNFFAWRFNVPFEINGFFLYLLGFCVFFLGFYLIYFSNLGKKLSIEFVQTPTRSRLLRNFFLVFSSLYLICFLAGMNYDYRLTFLIISLLTLRGVFPDLHTSRLLEIVQVGALWATIFFFGLTGPVHVFLAIFGNVCQLILAVYLLGAIYRLLEPSNAFNWVLEFFTKVSRKGA
jgi:hypothetical protein